ncbi:MAG: alpha/beta fold hydrolase [Acidobacteria bacterium]|nr:alpha/beta fold hydrolase [Acidobacteriota bacterium]
MQLKKKENNIFEVIENSLDIFELAREDAFERCKREFYRGVVRTVNAVKILVGGKYLTNFERTPEEVVMFEPQFKLKRFWQDYQKSPYTPILFIPPLMVTPQIYDLRPRHSFVRHLLNYDFDVFMLDFGSPTRKDKNICLDDYVRNIGLGIDRVRELTNSPTVSLIGYSMGGIFSNIFAALDEHNRVSNIVALGSPCDISRWPTYGELAKTINKPINLIADTLEGVPAYVSRSIFEMMKPLNTVSLPANLMLNLWDEEYIEGYEAMERWFDDFVAYPRDAFKQFFNEVVTDNKLFLGELVIEGKKVDLNKIESSYLILAGKQDFLGHPDSVKPIVDVISSKDKTYHEVSGGHLGMLAGKHATDTWEYIAQWLIARSKKSNYSQEKKRSLAKHKKRIK